LTRYIDTCNIPQRYGGTLAWDFGDPVSLDEDAKHLLGLDRLPRGPVRFSVSGGFKMVGSGRTEEELREAKAVAEHVKEELKANGTTAVRGQENHSGTKSSEHSASETMQPNGAGLPRAAEKGIADGSTSTEPRDEVSARQQTSEEAPTASVNAPHEHTIADAAREHPEAPIKDLAAALEGTTL
jgi:hypothetical protein